MTSINHGFTIFSAPRPRTASVLEGCMHCTHVDLCSYSMTQAHIHSHPHITIYRYTDTSVSPLRFSKPEQNHLEEESSNLSLFSGTSCNMLFPLGRYPRILSRIAGEAEKAESYLSLSNDPAQVASYDCSHLFPLTSCNTTHQS